MRGTNNATGSHILYDRHLAYRQDFMDVGPRFFVRTRLIRQMLRGERGRLLDVGCGDGFFLQELARVGFTCVGIDASSQAIELCRARVAPLGIPVYCATLEELQEAPFDVAVCGEVLEHIEDDAAFLRQIAQHLVVGGTLVLTVPLDQSLWDQADVEAGHFRRYSVSEIMTKLAQTGFVVERRVVWGWPLMRSLHFWIRRQQKKRMGGNPAVRRERDRLLQLKALLRLTRYLFLVDHLFDWTERGVGIVLKARRSAPAADRT